MTTRTDTLKVRLEADDDGRVHASLVRAADDAKNVQQATDKIPAAGGQAAGALDKTAEAATRAGGALGGAGSAAENVQRTLSGLARGETMMAGRGLLGLAESAGLLSMDLLAAASGITLFVGELYLFYEAGEHAAKIEQRLNDAIVSTGNAAGLTHASLTGMINAIATGNDEFDKAGDILLSLAANGRIGAQSIEAIGEAARVISDVTGKGADDAAKMASEIFSGSIPALQKADEQWHFLNASVMAQVQALTDAGNTQDAMRVAAEAFYDAVQPRLDEHESQLGTVTQWWHSAKRAFEDYVHSIQTGMSVLMGTADLQTQIYALRGKIDTESAPGDFGQLSRWMPGLAEGLSTMANLGSSYADDMRKLKELEAQLHQQQDKANAEAEQHRQDSQAADDVTWLAGVAKTWSDRETKRASLIAEIVERSNRAIANANAKGDKDLAAQLIAQEEATIAAVNKRFAGQGNKGHPRTAPDHTDRLREMAVSDLLQQVAAEGKLADLKDRQQAQIDAYNQNLDRQLAIKQQLLDLDVQSYSMGDKEIQRQQALLQIRQRYARAQEQLDRQHADKSRGMDEATYQAESDALQRHLDDELQRVRDHYRDMDSAAGNWRNGLVKAMQDWRDAGMDVASQTNQAFTNLFGGMTDAVINFTQTGKLEFGDMVKSFMADLARMELRVLESRILQSILGAVMTGPAQYNMGYFGTYSQSATNATAASVVGNIMGGYAEGGVSKGKQLAWVSEGQYDTEAHVPLPDGRSIPVTMTGGASSADKVIVNITNRGEPVRGRQTGIRQQGGTTIVDMVLESVSADIVQGGRTSKAMQQYFGLSRRGTPMGG